MNPPAPPAYIDSGLVRLTPQDGAGSLRLCPMYEAKAIPHTGERACVERRPRGTWADADLPGLWQHGLGHDPPHTRDSRSAELRHRALGLPAVWVVATSAGKAKPSRTGPDGRRAHVELARSGQRGRRTGNQGAHRGAGPRSREASRCSPGRRSGEKPSASRLKRPRKYPR